jgi:hypothetical protein
LPPSSSTSITIRLAPSHPKSHPCQDPPPLAPRPHHPQPGIPSPQPTTTTTMETDNHSLKSALESRGRGSRISGQEQSHGHHSRSFITMTVDRGEESKESRRPPSPPHYSLLQSPSPPPQVPISICPPTSTLLSRWPRVKVTLPTNSSICEE